MIEMLSAPGLDWVYIDAAHDYDSVARDLAVAARKIKSGGFICGHDHTRWGVKGLYRFGVVEAVNIFCQKEGWELVCLTNESHRHLSFMLRIKDALLGFLGK